MLTADSGKDTLVFVLGEPDPDPVFFGVVFYGSDRIWLIDADQEVGTALEDGIKAMWVDGIRDARVRERHAREIKLRGSPCECSVGASGRYMCGTTTIRISCASRFGSTAWRMASQSLTAPSTCLHY